MASFNPLVVVMVAMHENENATLHHTNTFELVHLVPPTPVLRRGQSFSMALMFDREINATDIVKLMFSFGANPDLMKGTIGEITIANGQSYFSGPKPWGVGTFAANGKDLSIAVTSPVDSPVGVWKLHVGTTISGSQMPANSYHFDRSIYLLFNPWVKDDLVYMEDEKLLGEYILNDVGKIWRGTWKDTTSTGWIFGQSDASVLPACQLMLERSGVKDAGRGDPVEISRAISRIVNANDDNGVLAGRWDGQYADGTSPSAWTGSVPILEQFLTTGKTVGYGQCWVFAGVVTTICRALGIPSRVVTNFESAHDTDGSLTIDQYYDTKGDELKSGDSIWNFHVWNDVWMARPGFPSEYGGWQVIDATPQETSDGMCQCGPASAEAIKRGHVGYSYDVLCMVASVNADVIRWKRSPDGFGYIKLSHDQNYIGRMILTKAHGMLDLYGDRDREDITSQYKETEGTYAERMTLFNASRGKISARRFNDMPLAVDEDVKFDLVEPDRVDIGKSITVIVNIQNNSNEVRSVQAVLSAVSAFYTGAKASVVKKETREVILEPNSSDQFGMTVTADDYLDKLVEECSMKLYASATVTETNQTWAEKDVVQFMMPTIQVKMQDKLVVGKPATIKLSFKNPLDVILTDCKFNYAGTGLLKQETQPYEDVGPGENVCFEHEIVPKKAGMQSVVAIFISKQLSNVTGSASVEVFDEDE